MTHGRMLVIGTYPITEAQHGGQKRTRAIVDAYRQVCNEVKYVAVFHKGYYEDYASGDIAVGAETIQKLNQNPQFADVIMGDAVYDDPQAHQKIVELLDSYRPDIIHIEQPYPYLGLKKILAERDHKPKLIFGSQNIEFEMKKQIFAGLGTDKDLARDIIAKTKKLEEDFSKEADLLVAVSKNDEAAHIKMGAKNAVVAQNGITPVAYSPAKLQWWQNFMDREYKVKRKIVFVGSAHPPNWFGFNKMVGTALGFIPSDTRLFLVGGISEYFTGTLNRREAEDFCFWQRAVPCGKPDDESLAALLADADVIILPITDGGGSNLKTAEAILNDKKVVATKFAFRSFEHLQKLPNLYISDDPEEFKANIVKALDAPHHKRTPAQQELAESVLWQNCLAELREKVGEL